MDKLALNTVTIWAASWSDDAEMQKKTIRVLRYCRKIIKCERMLFFTYMPMPEADVPFKVIRIPKLDWQTWNTFVNREVPKHVQSEFLMSVHEDGFPIDCSRWNPAFLSYDYIGAPWADGIVGNGGFNIESKRLLQEKLAMPTTPEEVSVASDMYICRNRSDYLKSKGITFAPRDTALTFSTETFGNQWPSFGFHGRTVSPKKYEYGWKLIQATEQKT